MGMQILNEDGSALYEFKNGLGVHLLYRIFAAAKFTGEADPLIILNQHVADVYRAIQSAKTHSIRPMATHSIDDMARRCWQRIVPPFRNAVLNGDIRWLAWNSEEKAAFVLDLLWAPWEVSEQFIIEFVEEEDAFFQRVKQHLNDQ